jgi:hypothetical protein
MGHSIACTVNYNHKIAATLCAIAQASPTYGTRAKRGTRNDFQWHAE